MWLRDAAARGDPVYFLDECGVNHGMHSPWARAPRGEAVYADVQGARRGRTSVISASLGNRLVRPLTFGGHCNAAVVETYFREMLLPAVPAGGVIVLDNASFHKSPALLVLAGAAGVGLAFLPAYSPEDEAGPALGEGEQAAPAAEAGDHRVHLPVAGLLPGGGLGRAVLDGEVAGAFFRPPGGGLRFAFPARAVGRLAAQDADVTEVYVVIDGADAGQVLVPSGGQVVQGVGGAFLEREYLVPEGLGGFVGEELGRPLLGGLPRRVGLRPLAMLTFHSCSSMLLCSPVKCRFGTRWRRSLLMAASFPWTVLGSSLIRQPPPLFKPFLVPFFASGPFPPPGGREGEPLPPPLPLVGGSFNIGIFPFTG